MEEEKEEKQEEAQEEEKPDKPDFEKKLDEIRAENDRMEKNINELKELKAQEVLSGKADAGAVPDKPQITAEEYAQKALKGELPEK